MQIQQGAFVEVRGRPWLVEAIDDSQPDLTTLRLSCIADDAQGEQIEVLWDAEVAPKVLDDDSWSRVGRGAPDSPEVLAAHLRTVRWRSASAPTATCCRRRSAPASGSTRISFSRCGRPCGGLGRPHCRPGWKDSSG